jgi:hypothetical protein
VDLGEVAGVAAPVAGGVDLGEAVAAAAASEAGGNGLAVGAGAVFR